MPDPVNSISVIAGTKIVSGYLTQFMAAENDLFLADGEIAQIESRQSPSQLTLRHPWPGETIIGSTAFNILSLGEYWRTNISTNILITDLLEKWEAGPIKWDAAGSLADRARYDEQGINFTYLAIEPRPFRLYVKMRNTSSPTDWSQGQRLGDSGPADYAEALEDENAGRVAADQALQAAISTLQGLVSAPAGYANMLQSLNTEIQTRTSQVAALQIEDGEHDFADFNLSQVLAAVTTLAQSTAANLLLATRVFPEQFGAQADNPAFDSGPALQAMFNHQLATGLIPCLKPNVRYYSAQTIVVDPSRNSLDGNNSIIDWRLKTFTDPALEPERVVNPGFDGPSSWIASPNQTMAPTFDGTLTFIPPDGENRYLEIGQKISAPAGAIIRVTMRVIEIIPHTVGINTYRDIGISFRRDSGTASGSIGAGGNVGGGNWFFSETEFAYKPGVTVTHDFRLTADNPYLRIQSNSKVRIDSIGVKVVPNNVCMKLTVPPGSEGGQLRGHNYRDWRNFKMVGRPGFPDAVFVIATEWDTPVYATNDLGQHSRAGWYNVDISEGIGYGLDFRDRTYLHNFYNCRIVTAKACIRTLSGAHDAGENIVFIGGNIGGGEIGVLNEGGFEIHMMSTSIDFSRQWYVGAGGFTGVGVHLETNAPTDPTKYLIDVYSGNVHIHGKLQVNGSTVAVLDTAFRVGKGGFLNIESESPYNIQGTSGAVCSGEGRIRFVARGGTTKVIEAILKRDDVHNVFGSAGGFETGEIGLLAWTSTATEPHIQVDRFTVAYQTEGDFTGTTVRGSDVLTNLSGPSGTNPLTTSREILLDGFPGGTTVAGTISATSVRATQNFNRAGGNYSGRWRLPNAAKSGIELSSNYARSGSKSLRLYRGSGGNSMLVRIAAPITPHHAAGMEMWWMIPPSTPGSVSVFFTGFFGRVLDYPGLPVPFVAPGAQFITDQPQTGIDRSVGKPWTRMSFHTHRVDASAAHDGYCPPGCTHLILDINLSSTPGNFEMYLDDLCASEF